MNGFNPMRWCCDEQGCFNRKLRPKIEMFHDCFPGNISFMDLDAFAERDGAFCVQEWKAAGGALTVGQQIAFKRLSDIEDTIVFVVYGNPETMEVWAFEYFWHGKMWPRIDADFAALHARVKGWSDFIDRRVAARCATA